MTKKHVWNKGVKVDRIKYPNMGHLKKHTLTSRLKMSESSKKFNKDHPDVKKRIGNILKIKYQKGIMKPNKTTFKKGHKPWCEGKSNIYASIRMKGKNNPNWKGGISPENERLRKNSLFKEWRELIFLRDNYICQMCYQRGIKLHPHHIKKFADYPELRFDIDNGITLCECCHKKTIWKENQLIGFFQDKLNENYDSTFAKALESCSYGTKTIRAWLG